VGLVLQLEYQRVGGAKADSSRALSFWDTYWTQKKEEPGLRTVTTCQELHKLKEYQDQSYTKLKLVKVCLGKFSCRHNFTKKRTQNYK